MRIVASLMTTDVSKLVYFGSFHSIMSYGVIFLGDSKKESAYSPPKRKLLQVHRKQN